MVLNERIISEQLQQPHVKSFASYLEHKQFPFIKEDKQLVKETIEAARFVVDRLNHISPNPETGRKGGVLLIHKPGVGNRTFTTLNVIGRDDGMNPAEAEEIQRSNVDKHALYAIGKALELVYNPELIASSQCSSSEDRITLRGKPVPGGALRVEGFIYSFSGYATPEEDECVILATLEERGILDRKKASTIADSLGNKKYQELVSQLVS